MINHYKERFIKIVKVINSDILKQHAQLKHQKTFIRKRKMPLEDIILCTLSKKGLTTEMELHKYFIEIGYYFQSSIKDAITRNETRSGKDFVPPKGIACTYNKLVVPSYDEGFDKLYYVTIGDDKNYLVEEWENEF